MKLNRDRVIRALVLAGALVAPAADAAWTSDCSSAVQYATAEEASEACLADAFAVPPHDVDSGLYDYVAGWKQQAFYSNGLLVARYNFVELAAGQGSTGGSVTLLPPISSEDTSAIVSFIFGCWVVAFVIRLVAKVLLEGEADERSS